MDINYSNLISVNEVLADVLVILADEDNSHLTPGYYISQVKNGLDELGFDISFLPVTTDIKISSDLLLDMPVGCFNLKTFQIYKGTPDHVGYVENVYWRKGVQTRGNSTGVTAGVNAWNTTDPFFRVYIWENQLYYFSVQNGIIRLSDACIDYDYARVTYDGLPSVHLDKVKMIPPEVRKALLDWTVVRCAGSLKMRDARYRIIETDAKRDLDEYGYNGSWAEAKQRLLRLDRKKLRDTILYNSKFNYTV